MGNEQRERLKTALRVSGPLAALVVGAVLFLGRPGPISRLPESVSKLVDAFEPDIAWDHGDPEEHGVDRECLDAFHEDLRSRRTSAFLLARRGRILYEEYREMGGADAPHYTAALAKALVGSFALLLAVEEGPLGLSDRASRFIPHWRDDPTLSRITIAQLASHTSGLEDVDFTTSNQGWKARYFENHADRFPLALKRSRVIHPPGTRYSYSGLGFYALSYAITASLQATEYPDIPSLLRERLMRPLGIPGKAWSMSYGRTYSFDGMTQVAIGSGAAFSPRAAGRLGQLVLQQGRWEGRELLSLRSIREMTRARQPAGASEAIAPAPALGWWVNSTGFWPEVPRDAIVGAGIGHQLVVVVPSLELVAVRMGEELEPPRSWGAPFWAATSTRFLRPLLACVGTSTSADLPATTVSSARRGASRPQPHPAPGGVRGIRARDHRAGPAGSARARATTEATRPPRRGAPPA